MKKKSIFGKFQNTLLPKLFQNNLQVKLFSQVLNRLYHYLGLSHNTRFFSSLWQLRCSLYDFYSNFAHNVEQINPKIYGVKKSTMFTLRLPSLSGMS